MSLNFYNMTDEDWDSLLIPVDGHFVGLPACCNDIVAMRDIILYWRLNDLNYISVCRFITLASKVMENHYLEYSKPFMTLLSNVKKFKAVFDQEVDEWEYACF